MLAGGRGVPIRLPAARPAPPPWHAPLAQAPAYHAPAGPNLQASPFSPAGAPTHPIVRAMHQARQRQIAAEQANERLASPEARRTNYRDSHPSGDGVLTTAIIERLTHEHPFAAGQRRFAQEGVRQLEANARANAEAASPLNLGFVNLAPAAAVAATIAQKAGIGHFIGGLPGKVANEALDLPGQMLLSAAQVVAAGERAGHRGDLLGAITAGPEMVGQQVLKTVVHPVRSVEEAPLATALTFTGGENLLGRLAGKAGRVAAPEGSALARALSTERPDLQLWNGLAKIQKYNSDPLRKLAQVGYEKSLPHLPGSYRQADPFQAEGRRLQHNLIGGLVHPGRMDYIISGADRQRRTLMDATSKLAQSHLPVDEHGKPVGQHLVPLITQRIVRTAESMPGDLAKEKAKLEASIPSLKGGELAKAKANLDRVNEVVQNKALMENPAPAFKAAAHVEGIQRPLEAALVHGGKLREEQLRAALFPYAQAHMGATHGPPPGPEPLIPGMGTAPEGVHALRGPDGRVLSNEAIIAHLADPANHGGVSLEPPTFLSHKEGIAGNSSYYRSVGRQPPPESHARTGAAFAKGTAEHSWEALVGTVAHQASEAAQLKIRAQNLSKLTQTPVAGGFKSAQDAQHFIRENLEHTAAGAQTGAPKFVPVHLGPNQILERGHVTPGEIGDTLRQFGLEHHSPEWAGQNGKYGISLDQVEKRMRMHEDAVSAKTDAMRALQAYTQGFRHAKLNTSTRHIAGVIQEQGIRLFTEGAGPRAAAAGKAIRESLERLSTHERESLADAHGPIGTRLQELEGMLATRGGQYTASGAVKGATDIRRTADQFRETSFSGTVMHAGHGFFRTTLPGNVMLKAWRGWENIISHGISVKGRHVLPGLVDVETFTHDAMLGKALRDSGFIPSYRAAIKMQGDVVDALVSGKLTPDMADHFARTVDDMMGNWTHLTPTVRRAVNSVTPFGLWWLNSMRWLYRLPVTHPIKTGIAAALFRATEAERHAKGQGIGAPGEVPGFLQGTIDATLPVVGRVHVAPSYYSPMGTLGAEYGNTAVEQFLPQFSGILSSLEGVNPLSHEPVTDAHGKKIVGGPIALNALVELLTGPTPFATQAQQALQQGGKPYGTANLLTDIIDKAGGPAQVKPGSQRPWPEVLTKMLSPLRFDFPRGGTGAAAPQVVGGGASSLPPGEAAELKREAQEQRSSGGSSGMGPGELAELKREAREQAGR